MCIYNGNGRLINEKSTDGRKLTSIPSGFAKTVKQRTIQYVKELREIVRLGLHEVVGKEVIMSWTQYGSRIVKAHGVVLHGWPIKSEDKFDPSKLTLREAEVVLQALRSGSCRWRKLSEFEEEERRTLETSYMTPSKVRKERADKGKKRGSYKRIDPANRSAEDAPSVDSADSPGDVGEPDDFGEPQHKRLRPLEDAIFEDVVD